VSGAAEELSLRVSVATLVRVLFEQPHAGEMMLALERKATVLAAAGDQRVSVRAQPFGGAIRFRNLTPLRTLIGDFLFDSERSRSESDFRILIRPTAWNALRQFCVQHLAEVDDPVLDSDPARELFEEFADALAINLQPYQYRQRPVGIIVVDRPAPTHNLRAPDYRTVRIYRIFEARIVDASLAQAMLANSERYSDQDLGDQALADVRNGGRGRANGIVALSLERLTEAYLAMPPEARAAPATFDKHQLDENVPAVLERVAAPIDRIL
jgi:hypothetical protein